MDHGASSCLALSAPLQHLLNHLVTYCQVEDPGTTLEIMETCSAQLASLDAKLAAAVDGLLEGRSGDLARQLLSTKEEPAVTVPQRGSVLWGSAPR